MNPPDTRDDVSRKIAAERHASLSRRHLLRGIGAAIALPAFLSLPVRGALAGSKKLAPTRMAFVYVPNGAIPSAFWPTGEPGADFALSPTLTPLANVHKQLQIISG